MTGIENEIAGQTQKKPCGKCKIMNPIEWDRLPKINEEDKKKLETLVGGIGARAEYGILQSVPRRVIFYMGDVKEPLTFCTVDENFTIYNQTIRLKWTKTDKEDYDIGELLHNILILEVLAFQILFIILYRAEDQDGRPQYNNIKFFDKEVNGVLDGLMEGVDFSQKQRMLRGVVGNLMDSEKIAIHLEQEDKEIITESLKHLRYIIEGRNNIAHRYDKNFVYMDKTNNDDKLIYQHLPCFKAQIQRCFIGLLWLYVEIWHPLKMAEQVNQELDNIINTNS